MSLLSNFQAKQNKIETANNITYLITNHISHTYIEYIQSTGTQYIKTDFTPSSDTTIELKYALTSTINDQGLLSAYTTWTDNSYLLYTYGSVNWTYGGKRNAAPVNTDIHTLNLYRARIIRDGTTVTNVTTGSFTNINTTIHLFAAPGSAHYSKMKLYYLKIWDSSGKLVREYVPCLDSNNVACLYDMCTKAYFYNNGTGVFTAGPRI